MGGPYALACGSAMPERASALALVSAAGPPPVFGPLGWRARPVRAVHHIARRPAGGRRPVGDSLAERIAYWRAVGGNAFRQGVSGAAGDLDAWRRPWGFDPSGVRAPVLIYHGEADRVVPSAVSRRYQTVFPAAVARYWPGEGHRALWAHAEEVLADLLAVSSR